ncbi:ATP-binding cassette domain-containing protein [Candidatus Uhrbacteria bacterium]|nr:ATP-binding cassette domain-containing protein [Candidatus Uhrbacteria bacterium]
MEELIRFENLYKVFNCPSRDERRVFELLEGGANRAEIKRQTGALVALRDISFNVKQGEFFVVMGLSGSGKSTLLRCLNRLVSPTRGKLLLGGRDLLGMGRDELTKLRREKMGMVFQSFALFPHRSVLENVAFGLELQGKNRDEVKERGERALALVGLAGWGENPISALSGGMKQRVGLARALASEPEVLLMDEPFSALDPLIRNRMQDELIKLQQELGKTTFFITHDLSEALKLGDRIGMLNGEGELVQVGTPKEILNSPANDYVKCFVENIHTQAELIQSL